MLEVDHGVRPSHWEDAEEKLGLNAMLVGFGAVGDGDG